MVTPDAIPKSHRKRSPTPALRSAPQNDLDGRSGRAGRAQGFNGHVSKPIDVRQWLGATERALFPDAATWTPPPCGTPLPRSAGEGGG
jgi:hypothetical protein